MGGGAASRSLSHGSVHVSPDRQQAIGVRVGVVNRVADTRLLRPTGRVVADAPPQRLLMAEQSPYVRELMQAPRRQAERLRGLVQSPPAGPSATS